MGKKKSILHVVNISFVLPYFIGDQFDYFQKKGHEMHVACSPSEHLMQFVGRKKLNVLQVNILREINFLQDIKAVIDLVRYIKKHQIEVVIGHTPKGGLVSMLAAYLCNIEDRIYFRHGLMFETSTGFKRLILKLIERLTGHLANKVICVSPSVLKKSITDKLSREGGTLLLNKGSCNGIDVLYKYNPALSDPDLIQSIKSKYGIQNRDFVVGYVGRLVNDKGIPELIQAWKMLKIQIEFPKLVLVGPFEDRDKIEEEYKQIINEDSTIVHIDLVENTSPYYALMNVFILASHREGLPTVTLEASAMELPVITTRSTGCVDSIVPNVTGIFVDITPISIKNGVEYYYYNQDTMRKHGRGGRQYVLENFRQEKIWREIESNIIG